MNFGNPFKGFLKKPLEDVKQTEAERAFPNPVIRIGEGRDILTKKLAYYEEKLKNIESVQDKLDVIYKMELIKELLKTGEVNTWILLKRLAEENKGFFNKSLFENACGVITDYIETGGKNLTQ